LLLIKEKKEVEPTDTRKSKKSVRSLKYRAYTTQARYKKSLTKIINSE